jgi:hypothetical protein
MSRLTVESLRTITVFKPLSDLAFADLSQRCVMRHLDPGELIIGHTDQTLDVYFCWAAWRASASTRPMASVSAFAISPPGPSSASYRRLTASRARPVSNASSPAAW